MSKISVDIIWNIGSGDLSSGIYSNKHENKFNSKIALPGDSAPDWKGDPNNTNPEQTLAASLSSCHMMTFLALAAKMKWPVLSYKDNTIATLGKNSEGKMSVTSIHLNPKVEFSKSFKISQKEMKEVQERAHRYCFIANSLSKEVEVKIN